MSLGAAEVIEALGLGAEDDGALLPAVVHRWPLTSADRDPHPTDALPTYGRVRFRKAGEHHAYTLTL